MTLFSLTFFIFLLITVLIYYIVPKKIQWAVLLAASYVFYCYGTGWKGVVFILVTTITTYLAARKIEKIQDAYQAKLDEAKAAGTKLSVDEKNDLKNASLKQKRVFLIAGLLLNFGILIVLKYGNFIIDNVDTVMTRFGMGGRIPETSFILPLGISFYTFITMGYLIDIYRNKYGADHKFFHFALFTAYFPQIIQGPIGRYNDMARQLEEPHYWNDFDFRTGFMRLLWGYFKKMIIAERAGIIVSEVFNNYESAGYKGFVIFVAALLYGFQIYADFSGGMDIVFGASDMLGIHLTENFRQPFYAKSVSEFWQRWHMTLGGWMKDYVFYPICLSKRAARAQKSLKKKFGNHYGRVLVPTFASFIAFLIVGIWHGAEWKYVIYGIFMATFVSSNTLFEKLYMDTREKLKIDDKSLWYSAFQIFRTTMIVLVGRFFSRAATATDAVKMIKAMFSTFNVWVFTDDSLLNLGLDQKNWNLLIIMIVFLLVVDHFNEKGVKIRERIAGMVFPARWIVYYTAIFAVLIFGIYGAGYNAASFIYQNF